MTSIIDTNHNTTSKLPQLASAGIKTIIRYYYRGGGEKEVHPAEAKAIAQAGLRLGVVYEGAGDRISAFSKQTGLLDAAHSRRMMLDIGQPAGSAVYFAADSDFSASQVRNSIIPYFQGVRDAFAEANGLPVPRVGVYGSGQVCGMIGGAGLAEYFWISCSTGWTGSREFVAAGKHNLLQKLPKLIAGLDTDPDEVNPLKPDFGDFVPYGTQPPQPQTIMKAVSARSGLNLRNAPSTATGKVVALLPYGKRVAVLSEANGWTVVDVDLDGKPDGYVASSYLVGL